MLLFFAFPSILPTQTMPRANVPTLLFLMRAALASPYLRAPINSEPTPTPSDFWSKLVISVFLVLAGGVFAGWGGVFFLVFFQKGRWWYLSTFLFIDWRLDLWGWTSCIFVCWRRHRRTWEKRGMLRKVCMCAGGLLFLGVTLCSS